MLKMTFNDKISVVVPIYNAYEFLEQCISSILNQSYRNLEIILINDGSSDNSIKIIKEFAKKDNRIKIVTKDNTGVSATRNLGIRIASGKYIIFIDADDWIDFDYIEKLYLCLKENNVNFVKSAFSIHKNDKIIKKVSFLENEQCILNLTEINKILIKDTKLNPSWGQLMDLEILKNSKIFFSENVRYAEDLLFNYKCFQYYKKIIYLNNFGYNCRVNMQSCSRTSSFDKQLNNIYDIFSVFFILLGKNRDNEVANKIFLTIINQLKLVDYSNIDLKTFSNKIKKIYITERWQETLKFSNKINGKLIDKILIYCLINRKIKTMYICFKINFLIKKGGIYEKNKDNNIS